MRTETDEQLRARLRGAIAARSGVPSPAEMAAGLSLVLANYCHPCFVVGGMGELGEIVLNVVSWQRLPPPPQLLYTAQLVLSEFLPMVVVLTILVSGRRDPRVQAYAPASGAAAARPALTAPAVAPKHVPWK